MNTDKPSSANGTRDAMDMDMNAAMQIKLRHIFFREFYRRGCLTWDMKMALQQVLNHR
jgi:hypothetical protein